MKPKSTILAGLAALAVLAAACGDSEEAAPESAAITAITPSAAVQDTAAPAPSAAAIAQPTAAASPSAAAPAKLNLNTATREQFLTVPGVGDRMVREFEEYRPYTSVAQFRREIGKYVAQDQVSAYLQHVFVPVDPNRADAETLQQLPGVDANDAAQLIAGRPYSSAEAFLARLGQFAGTGEITAARAYLAVW